MRSRRVVVCALVTLTLAGGCTRWQLVGHDTLTADPASLTWETLRLRGPRGASTVRAHRVAWPWLEGEASGTAAPVRVDLRTVSRVDRRVPDHLWNAIFVGAAYAMVTALAALAWLR